MLTEEAGTRERKVENGTAGLGINQGSHQPGYIPSNVLTGGFTRLFDCFFTSENVNQGFQHMSFLIGWLMLFLMG